MKKIIKLAILMYILGKGGAALGKAVGDLQERVDITRRTAYVSSYAEELFSELGFEPQNPSAM